MYSATSSKLMVLKIAAALCTLILTSRAFSTEQTSITTGIDPNCTTSVGEGNLTVYYDDRTELINMIVNIPKNSYAGFGWGPEMKDTELVVFQATDTVDENTFITYKGVGETWPELDSPE